MKKVRKNAVGDGCEEVTLFTNFAIQNSSSFLFSSAEGLGEGGEGAKTQRRNLALEMEC